LVDKGLVDLPSAACNSIRSFFKASNSSDWLAVGKRLMLHQEYEEAKTAFSRAGDPIMVAVATACCLRQIAYDTLEERQRRGAFLRAAAAFVQCAAESDDIDGQHDYYAIAAECYAKAKNHAEAIRSFNLAERHAEAALHCLHHGLLGHAVTTIKKYRAHIDQETIERVKEEACLEYLKEKKLE
jgi:tetratricopeptide (TPR) repeat protein